MIESLYDVLGVGKDADSFAIKKAYRRKAQKLHPDKEEGDSEAFQELVSAYEVLIDEHKRKRYDEDGSVINDAADEHNHLREVVAVLFSLIDKVDDVAQCNLINETKRAIKVGIDKAQYAIRDLKEQIETRQEILKRLSCKSGPNLLAAAIENDIARCEGRIKSIDENIVIGKAILAMLDTYEYRTDPQNVASQCYASFRPF